MSAQESTQNSKQMGNEASDQTSVMDTLAARYAGALFELAGATDKATQSRTRQDMAALGTMLKTSPDFARIVRSPVIDAATQADALQAVLAEAKISDMVTKFIALVTRNRRIYALGAMVKAYAALGAQADGQMRAEIIAAEKLSPAQEKNLHAQLKKTFGQDVHMQLKIDPRILGGLIVKMGSRMIDGSLRTKLNTLEQAMNEVG